MIFTGLVAVKLAIIDASTGACMPWSRKLRSASYQLSLGSRYPSSKAIKCLRPSDHHEHSIVFTRHSSFEVQTIIPDVDKELLS